MTSPQQRPISMSSPDITQAERDAVMAVLQTTNLSIGPQVEAFECAFESYTGARHAIAVSSGTAGLHLCVRAAGIQAGDLVLTTPFSFVASTNVILFENAIPVFVDVLPTTGNLDTDRLAEVLEAIKQGGNARARWLPRIGAESSGPVKAVLPVDVFGQPADLDKIQALAVAHDLVMIEDSCEALGAEYKKRMAGTFGRYGVFGFYPNKQITTGEGGMIITDDSAAAQYMRALRNQGRAPGDTWLSHTYLGYNYRLDEMSSALGLAQLNRIEELLVTRQRVADWYAERLRDVSLISLPGVESTTTRNSWFVYVIRLDPEVDRELFAAKMAEKGVPVRPYFLPIHLQPYMVERFGYKPGDFPVTEDLGRRGIALPFSGVMSEDEVDYVCQTLQKVLVAM